jgi:hypothetical protein
MPSDFSLDKRSKELEEAFFNKQNQKLIDELKKMKAMEETKEALQEASGISDDGILQKLVELDIHAEMVAALTAVPLIEVAWADGHVDEKEKQAILDAAREGGISPESHPFTLLSQWLSQKPTPELMEAWEHYMQGLCAALSAGEVLKFKKDLLDRARRVAEAAGGFLGLTSKISASEQKMLDRLEEAFPK